MRKLYPWLLCAALMIPFAAGAQTLTVADGTAYNNAYPVRGSYCDYGTQSEIIYPASMLSDMNGGTITKLTFYTYNLTQAVNWGSSTQTVRLEEVSNTTETTGQWSISSSAQTVYTGQARPNQATQTLEIELDEPYQYGGGNLAVNFLSSPGGSYLNVNFYGFETSSNTGGHIYNNSAGMSTNFAGPSTLNGFLPKCTFEFTEGALTCPRPRALAVSDITADGATFSWTAAGSETSWEYLCIAQGATPDWSTASTVTSAEATVTGLDEYSDYTFYVRAYCSADDQSHPAAVTFHTSMSCAADGETFLQGIVGTLGSNTTVYPFYQSTSYTTASSWQIYTADQLEEADIFAGTIKALAWNVSSGNSTCNIRIYMGHTTKSVFNSGSDTTTDLTRSMLTLVYDGPITLTPGWSEVMLTTPFQYDGASNLVVLAERTSAVQGSVNMGYFSAGSGNQTIYRYGNSASTSSSLSNIRLSECVGDLGCLAVESVSLASEPTEESVELSWTDTRNTDATYFVRYCPVGSTDTLEYPNINATSVTISGLQANTIYWFGVGTTCGSETAARLRGITARTACGLATPPYVEDFESYGSSATDLTCWTRLSTGNYSNYPYVNSGSSYAHNGNKGLYFYVYYTYDTNLIVAPQVNISGPMHVNFWFKPSSTSYGPVMEAGVITDPADRHSFVPLLTIVPSNNNWTEYEFYTDEVDATDAQVAFRFSHTGSSSTTANLDDLTIEAAGDCRRPVNARISGITHEGATVRWSDNGSGASGYVVRVAAANNVNAAAHLDFNTTDTEYDIDGLTPSTHYYAWVTTLCGTDTLQWRAAGDFTTYAACYPVSGITAAALGSDRAILTWETNAHGVPVSEVNIVVQNITDPFTGFDGDIDIDVANSMAFITGLAEGNQYKATFQTLCDDYTAANQEFSFTPQGAACGTIEGNTTNSIFPLHGNYRYSFTETLYPASALQGMNTITGLKYRIYSTPSNYPNRPVKVWMASTDRTQLDTNDFEAVANMTLVYEGNLNVSSTGWAAIGFSQAFTPDEGENVLVAVLNTTGNYSSFSFGAHTGDAKSGVYWYRDGDVAISADNPNLNNSSSSLTRGTSSTVADIQFVGDCQQSDCKAPLVVAGERGETTLEVMWMAGGTDAAWTVQYRAFGESDWQTAVASTTATSLTIQDLDPDTRYSVRVGSLCTDETLFAAPIEMRTLCGDISLPWSEDFESWDVSSFSQCWERPEVYSTTPYASTTSHTGTRALYLYTSSSTVGNLAVTPTIPHAANELYVTFWARLNNSSDRLQVGYVTDRTDASSFVSLGTITGYGTTSWSEYEFYTDQLDIADQVSMAFRLMPVGSGSSYAYIDDIAVSAISTCRRPSDPSISNVSYYSADLAWSYGGSAAAQFEVRYGRVNSVDNEANITLAPTSDTTLTLTGLQHNTTYYAWVRSLCGSDQTQWLYLGQFSTPLSCYSVTGLTVTGVSYSNVTLSWNYSTSGLTPDGAWLTLTDLTDASAAPVSQLATGTTAFFSGLEMGHDYRVTARSLCNEQQDTASATNVTFSTPTCGEFTGTTTCYYAPFNGNYGNGYSQMIYPASAAGGITEVEGIRFSLSSTPSNYYQRPVKVWMANTSRTTVDTNDYVDTSAMTLVYDGTIDLQHTGWTALNFDQTFTLNPDSNILVAVQNNMNQYASFNWNAVNASAKCAVYWYRDYLAINAGNPNERNASGTLPSRGTQSSLPAISFLGDCNLGGCLPPLVAVTGVDTSTVALQWVPGGNETAWTVEYHAAGETEWQVAIASTTQASATVTDLLPATTYEFRVGAICSDVVYSTSVSALTECAPMPLPQTFTFLTNAALGPCWHLVSSSAYVSSPHLYLSSYSAYAVTPELRGDLSAAQVRLTGRLSSSSNTYRLRIGISTDGTTANTTWVDTIQLSGTNAEYVTYLNTYTAGGHYVVLNPVEYYSTVYIDSLTVEPLESCLPVEGLTASAAGNEVTLAWTASDAESFEVEYSTNGQTWVSESTTSNSATLTLSYSTAYQFRVRALCSDESASRWTYTSAVTGCGPVTEFPWVEDFNTSSSVANSDMPATYPCWNFYTGQLDEATVTANLTENVLFRTTTYGMNGSINLTVNIYGTSNYRWAVTPTFELTSGLALSFRLSLTAYNSNSAPSVATATDDKFLVLATTDGGTTWQILDSWGTGDDYNHAYTALSATVDSVVIPLASLAGQSVRFAFYGESTVSGGDNDLHIDDLTVALASGELPQPELCGEVTGVSHTATTTTITLDWDANGDDFEVAIVSGSSWTNPAPIADNSGSHLFSDLQPNTTYTVGVRRVCTESNSEWTTRTVTTDQQVGISNFEIQNSEFELYPNPATSEVTVSVNNLEIQNSKFEILSLSGQVLDQFEIHNSKFKIDISSLPAGAYFIRLTGQQQTAVRKLIVK